MTDALLDVEVRGHDLSLFSVWRQLVKHDRINELDVNTTFIKKHLVHTHTHARRVQGRCCAFTRVSLTDAAGAGRGLKGLIAGFSDAHSGV